MPTWEVYIFAMVEAEDREKAVEKVQKKIAGRLGILDIFEVRKLDND